MKNFTIPRTMAEGHWSFNADPISHYPQAHSSRLVDRIILLACALILPFVLWLAVFK